MSKKQKTKREKKFNAFNGVFVLKLFMGGGDWWNNLDSAHLMTGDVWSSFWWLFALFFPAMTGLQAGIGLSGELTDPKRQIVKGVLWAIVVLIALTPGSLDSIAPLLTMFFLITYALINLPILLKWDYL